MHNCYNSLAPSHITLDDVHAMFAHISKWADDHYMGVGVKKGGMALSRATPTQSHYANKVLVGDLWVPIVSEYRYLGALIKSDLGMRSMARAGSTTAAAPEWGTLACMSAITPIPLVVGARRCESSNCTPRV
jgi:hypothetical protein